jgi:hypothetical protein
MKQYAFLLFIASFLVFSGCKDSEEKVAFTLTFKALYNGVPFAKNKYYDYDTYKIQFSKFHTYLSDITLLNGSKETQLSEIEFIDFTPGYATNDNAIDVVVRVKAPAGDYTGVKMGYGVKSNLNSKKPANYASGHPLANEDEYWSGWKSYIFAKIEGQTDSNNDGTDEIFNQFHFGSDAVYRTFSFDKDLTITENTNIGIEIDVKNIFFANNTWWDMRLPDNGGTSHSATDVRVSSALVENWDNATTIK